MRTQTCSVVSRFVFCSSQLLSLPGIFVWLTVDHELQGQTSLRSESPPDLDRMPKAVREISAKYELQQSKVNCERYA